MVIMEHLSQNFQFNWGILENSYRGGKFPFANFKRLRKFHFPRGFPYLPPNIYQFHNYRFTTAVESLLVRPSYPPIYPPRRGEQLAIGSQNGLQILGVKVHKIASFVKWDFASCMPAINLKSKAVGKIVYEWMLWILYVLRWNCRWYLSFH